MVHPAVDELTFARKKEMTKSCLNTTFYCIFALHSIIGVTPHASSTTGAPTAMMTISGNNNNKPNKSSPSTMARSSPPATATQQPPSFLTTSDGCRLAYHLSDIQSSNTAIDDEIRPIVIFCCGFRSNMDGSKALWMERHFCQQQYATDKNRGITFCRFDYRGHGQSISSSTDRGGSLPQKKDKTAEDTEDLRDIEFAQFTLGDWIADTESIIQHVTNHTSSIESKTSANRPVILVGSSMGAWIALHVALRHLHHIVGLLLLAPAPDFLNDLWENATPEQAQVWSDNERDNGNGNDDPPTGSIVFLPTEYEDRPYPVSQKLMQDARTNWLLLDKKGKIDVRCPVRLIHGQADVDISYKKSLQVADKLETDDVVVTLVKGGDHRLSRPDDLKRITSILDELIDASI